LAQTSRAKDGVGELRNDSLEEAVKREMNENELVSARSLAQSVQSVDPENAGGDSGLLSP
jgi:hypothetical protein